jgi:hypothetical protein
MASKVRNFSVLVDDQLPKFIASEYPKFSSFLQKYYEQLELPGQPIDLIANLPKYRDSDTYEKDILRQNTKLTATVDSDDTSIYVESTESFPETNGYILVDNEVIFYKSKSDTSFDECYRNVSATTTLGDLYNESEFKYVENFEVGSGVEHISGRLVTNISNLFLYALVKNFEAEYLTKFPAKDLKDDVDKTLLIKNIKKFYSSKGTEQSIKFIFNSIVAKDPQDIPTVYYPKDSTYKLSNGEWINTFSLKVKLINGDVKKFIGEKLIQEETIFDSSIKNTFAIIDNVKDLGDDVYELILAPESIVGEFAISAKTFLTKNLLSTDTVDDRINVYSTLGWNDTSGAIYIGNEIITFKDKTVNQFIIANRNDSLTYSSNEEVYSYSNVYVNYFDDSNTLQKSNIIILGVLYNLIPDNEIPYSQVNDLIQVSSSGFETRNAIIYDNFAENIRWILNEDNLTVDATVSGLDGVLHSVSAIYEDDQYYYITSSGYPAHPVGKNTWTQTLQDQKKLKLIRKNPSKTTEIYKTESNEVGILVNGTTVRSYKGNDENLVIFGEITNVTVTNQGSGYVAPPYVLIQDGSGEIVASAKAILNGEVVERIEVIESGAGFFPPVPIVTITSGRGAIIEAVVTRDKVTNLRIINPGEYYSSPPRIIIRDKLGKGRFADYTAQISNDGKIIGFVKNSEGKFYTQENIEVIVEPVGARATATSNVRSWRRNLFIENSDNLDTNYGFYFLNNNPALGYGYSYLANPKSLRVSLADNLDNLGNVPSILSHSPVLGYAFDGNPIYGPYGFSDALDSESSIERMTSSYFLNNSRTGGPSISLYPLGYFVDDYTYNHRSGSLDENNGRFCVTPEYPNGTYAYFVTIDSLNNPVFPYVIGENFYSLPVDSNYNKIISQDLLPKNVSRLRTSKTIDDGEGVFAFVNDTFSGVVSGTTTEYSPNTFSVGSSLYFDNTGTNGGGLIANVDSVKGKSVLSIESQQNKAIKINTQNSAYLFDGDILTQNQTNAYGEIVGNVFDNKTIVLRNTVGTFDENNTLYSSTVVSNLILDKSSDYKLNSEVILTNGKQIVLLNVLNNSIRVSQNPFINGEPIIFSNTFSNIISGIIYYVRDVDSVSFKVSETPNGPAISLSSTNTPESVAISQKAKGLVLETTLQRNSLKIKNLQGEFSVDNQYFLKSNNLEDTIGSKIVNINSLSSDIRILSIDDNIAIVETDSEHGIAKGEIVNIDISPNDTETETTLYVRKRIYQTVKLNTPIYTKYINDTGVGRLGILNNGSYNNTLDILQVSRSANVATVTTALPHNLQPGDEVSVLNLSGYDTVNAIVLSSTTLTTFSYANIGQDESTRSVSTGNIRYSAGDYAYSYTGKNHVFNNVELIFSDISKSRDSEGRIVGNSTLSFIGRPKSVNNAKANITVQNGVVANIEITSKGKGYKRGDLLTVNPNDLDRDPLSISTRFLTVEVEHVGFSDTDTSLYLNDVQFISVNDFLKIGKEIVKVQSINSQNSFVVVSRSEENTQSTDHYNLQEVSFYNAAFNLPQNYQLGSSSADPYVHSYDEKTATLVVVYDIERLLSNINKLVPNAVFFDNSIPQKLISISDIIETSSYKFEFSYDQVNWKRNPILNLQKFYKYIFDTSNQTLRGSFLEFSPSGNFNIITEESTRSEILPGNAGSFVALKIGYGPLYNNESNNLSKKFIDYNNYFYFDKNGIIDSDKSYVRLVNDPLQGEKIVSYVTPTKFVYEMNEIPQYDGTGSISYTTKAIFAEGSINSIRISNQGTNYTQIPTVIGVVPSSRNECIATVNWNPIFNNISSITINSPGKNYSKPKAILLNSTGSFASFDIIKNDDGSIAGIVTINKGINYTEQPIIKILETDVKIYASSKDIGKPRNVKLLFNGKNFSRDNSLKRNYTGVRILILSNISDSTFIDGEKIEQYEQGTLIASGYISKNGWKEGSNIIRLRDVEGQFKINEIIIGKIGNRTAKVEESITTIFGSEIKSYFDNLGYYSSDKGHISSNSQKLLDSYFYQDYSYVIKSKTPINIWRSIVKNTTHPAGFEIFGEVSIESEFENAIPIQQPSLSRVSIVELWNPEKNKVTVENTYKTITQSFVNISDTNVIRGRGSVYSSDFDTGETIALDFTLTPNFDGYFNEQGNVEGTKTFTITLLGTNSAYSVPKEENIIVSLDGIVQEPGKSFTVSGNQITFNTPPLGYRSVFGDSIPFSSYREGVDTPPQKIVGKIIRFKDTSLNNQYYRKLLDISSEFDNEKRIFDLYYEDLTPVELDADENLIVSIDGVVQRAGMTPLLPGDRSYYIRKTVVPNQIIFVEPPRKFESQTQSFYAFSIGSYERLKLDTRYIDGIRKGPFILRSALTNKTITVDEDRNVLVFVDQVLQRRNKNYTIRGSNITFTESISPDQKINIIYAYGRKSAGSITAFNYDTTTFLNRVQITISGNPVIYQLGTKIYSVSASGTLKSYYRSGANTILIVDTLNPQFSLQESFTIVYYDNFYAPLTISSSDIVSITEFEENDIRQDILRKNDPGWLINYNRKNKNKNFVRINDLIKIDGESDYRKILSTPEEVIKTDYRNTDIPSSSYFNKIQTTNYNDIARGEGLDVIAEIENGKVVSLLWNKIEWGDYVTKRILPSSPGYGYETAPQLVFVAEPQKDDGGNIIAPAQGGGAKAYVLVYDGQVIDIVLYDQGSEYLVPPRVYVSRSFDIIQKNRSITTNRSSLSLSPIILSGANLFVSVGDRLDSDSPPATFIVSTLITSPLSVDEYITAIIQREFSSAVSSQTVIYHTSTVDLQLNISSISVITDKIERIFETPLSVATFNKVTVSNIFDYYLSQISTFAKVNYIFAYRSMHETGAYLDAPMEIDDTVAYISDTTKFEDNGKLLIEDEVVYYGSKLSDRFVDLIRGVNGTTAKYHAAGSFVRQYRDDVSVIDVGVRPETRVESTVSIITITNTDVEINSVVQIYSEVGLENFDSVLTNSVQIDTPVINIIVEEIDRSTFIDISMDISLIESNVARQINTIVSPTIETISSSSVRSVSNFIELFKKSGVVDYYIESILLTDSIKQRDGNIVLLDDPINTVYQRNGDIVLANNAEINDESLLSYTLGNIGNVLGMFNNWYSIDTGTASVSGLTFNEIEVNYNEFTIKDFEERYNSSISLSRKVWNLTYSSIQNPVTTTTSSGNINNQIIVINTDYFPSSGYIYHSNGSNNFGVFSYTSKTKTSFLGCVVYSGSNTIVSGSILIPYSI